MLCLTRLKNQGIRIGKDITIKLLHVGSKRVTIGVEAPQKLRVSRVDDMPHVPNKRPKK
jgi:carbon storage regulator CsrA